MLAPLSPVQGTRYRRGTSVFADSSAILTAGGEGRPRAPARPSAGSMRLDQEIGPAPISNDRTIRPRPNLLAASHRVRPGPGWLSQTHVSASRIDHAPFSRFQRARIEPEGQVMKRPRRDQRCCDQRDHQDDGRDEKAHGKILHKSVHGQPHPGPGSATPGSADWTTGSASAGDTTRP